MAAIADADVSIDTSGNIRWTGAATTNRHSILEFIQWLMLKQDDDQAVGDDLLDITVDTPFDRSTNQIVSLNSPFNIDDTFAKHLYDGSVSQSGGDTLYSGLSIIGPVETGTEYMVIQDGKCLPSFWGTGINPEAAPSLVFSRHLVKSRDGGADIDGKRIIVLARELGDQYRRFPVTLGTGNSVAAIGNGADVFNAKSDATLAGYTSIVNTEGFQEINIDGTGAAGQEFYSKWDIGTQSINDTYERTKWISQRAHTADSNAETGNDFVIDDNNTTSQGQGTEFSATAAGEVLTAARLRVKIGAGTAHTGTLYCELWDSDDLATAEPTGGSLARSEGVLASAITSSYEDIIFRFNRLDPSDGTNQVAGLTMVADQEYFIVIRHAEGTASDYFHVEGDTTTADDGNQAIDLSGTWTGTGTSALNFSIYSSPAIHGVAGETFQGIDVEVAYDGEAGAGVVENEVCFWGTRVVYDTLVSGPFQPGEYVKIENGPTLVNGGKMLFDDGTDELILSLEDTSGNLADGYTITGITSGATCDINVTIENDDKGGGEALVLADDDNTTTGELYLQIMSGTNPVENVRIRSATTPLTNYVDATATINSRTIVPEFIGTSTGSNIIGTYGIGFDDNDVGSSDRFTSLDNSPRIPPNNQTFTVSGLVSGEDRVLVGPRNGTALAKDQFSLFTTLSGAAEVAIVIADGVEDGTPLAVDIPKDGTANNTRLRVQLDTGIYRRQAYTDWNTSTFTIPSTDYTAGNVATSGNDVFVAFIDVLADATTENYTATYTADRDLFVRVRDGGGTPIKTFESDAAQFLGTPQTVAAVRTSDA